MQKRTRSLLEELDSIMFEADSNIIADAINLLKQIALLIRC